MAYKTPVQTLAEVLEKTHDAMKARFKPSQDEQKAQRLEKFFNAVVYNASTKGLRGVLNASLADAIRLENPGLIAQFSMTGSNAYYTGQIGEEAFGKLLIKTIDHLDTQGGKNNISVNAVLAGKETVRTIKQFGQNATQLMSQELNQENATLDGVYYTATQQKTDLNTNTLVQTYELTPTARELLSLTASVKNYQAKSTSVTLGHRHILKILRSTIHGLNIPLTEHEAQLIDNKQRMGIKQYSKHGEIQKHLSHLQYAYELTGIGQMQSEDVSRPAEYPRFLFINLRGERIIVRSTIALINQMLQSTSSGIIDGTKFILK